MTHPSAGITTTTTATTRPPPPHTTTAIPLRLPMPVGIEIHNCCCVLPTTSTTTTTMTMTMTTTTTLSTTIRDDPTTTTTATTTTAPQQQQQSQQQPTELAGNNNKHMMPKSSSSSSSSSTWFPKKKRTEYSMRLLPHKIRLELCLIPASSSSLHEKEEEDNNNEAVVDDGALSSTDDDGVCRRKKIILGGAVDTRRSTRVIFPHVDDLVTRDDLDIYSYEQLTARFYAEYYHSDDAGDATAAAAPDGLSASRRPPSTSPSSSSSCFVQANLHPSRLCRIPNMVVNDHTVLALLPKNSIMVYFSDQSVRVPPYLYQLLRSVHERYVTVREERIFTDTAFASLDQHPQQKQNPTITASPDIITASKDDEQRRLSVHQSDGSNRTLSKINNNDEQQQHHDKKDEKPTSAAVELDDLRVENELLSRELVRQEEWLQEELSNNVDTVQTKTLPALQATLDELQQQNAQLLVELDRRRQRADYLEFVLHSERIRLVREVSLLYDINTTTTTPSAACSSSAERNDGSNNNGDHTTLTMRGMNLSANGVISFINHLVHVLLPKYLGVYVRPPPPPPSSSSNTTPSSSHRTAAQRTLVWQATLQCLARHIGLPSSTSSFLSTTTTTTNHPPPPSANVLHSIREIYDHMLQYRQPDNNDDQVVVVDSSGS